MSGGEIGNLKFEIWERTMKELLIITCIYNRLPLVKECVEAVRKYTTGEYIHALVYNHPPYPEVKKYVLLCGSMEGSKVIVLDPGKNLGCHDGFNHAFDILYDEINPDYVVKLDDDTVVPEGWNEPMMEVLDTDMSLAYVSSVDKNAKQGGNFRYKKVGRYTIEMPRIGVVGFSCVMFPGRTIDKFGKLYAARDDSLYGGEEHRYFGCVTEQKMYGAYIQEVVAHHLGNEDRDIDYVLWKYWYGYMDRTRDDLTKFKNNKKELITAYKHMLTINNEWWRETAARRLEELNKPFFNKIFKGW